MAETDKKYTCKITAPIYTPGEKMPLIGELIDDTKYWQLIRGIEKASLPTSEKLFLIRAAERHIVFNFQKIADYYAHASKEMQEVMEQSALVIIDFKKAIEEGYVKLSAEVAKQYMEEHGDETE